MKDWSATYTYEDVHKALNQAANDILEALTGPAHYGEGPVADATSLMVNVGLCYLDGRADTLAGAIESSYAVISDDIDEGKTLTEHVLGWLEG